MRYTVCVAIFLLSVLSNADNWNGNYDSYDGMGTVVESPDGFYFGAGIGALANLDEDNPAYQFFAGKFWSLNPIISLKTVIDGASDFDDSYFASALVGAHLYPIMATHTPYLGTGLGIGYARSANETDVFGFELQGVFGVLMFRGAPVEVGIEGNANILFNNIDDDMPMVYT